MTQILKPAENLVLIYDTETSGFPLWKDPSEDPRQPHIVDLCAILYTPEGEVVDMMETMIRPDGWIIPDEVAEVHGITTDIATINGIDEIEALAMFGKLHKRASLRVAHNVSFDDRIMRIGIKRFFGDGPADRFKAAPNYCTANAAKPLCKCPPTEKMLNSRFKNTFKTPTVAEALKILLGEELVGAHRARPDTEACAKVYFHIQSLRP